MVKIRPQEVSLGHFVREVDVQPNHLRSSPRGRRFEFLLFQKKTLGASPTAFFSKEKKKRKEGLRYLYIWLHYIKPNIPALSNITCKMLNWGKAGFQIS
jgi:hypothetical protein